MPRCTSLRAAGTLYVPFQPTSGFSKRQVQRQWVVSYGPPAFCRLFTWPLPCLLSFPAGIPKGAQSD